MDASPEYVNYHYFCTLAVYISLCRSQSILLEMSIMSIIINRAITYIV